jgi:F-type H+-transporting ATPase subunit delta
MAEMITIARPYTKAIFDLAIANNSITEWSKILSNLALISHDQTMQKLISDPRVTREQLVDIFSSICGKNLNHSGLNLLKLLAEHSRLCLLPAIAALFEEFRAAREKLVNVIITSARAIPNTVQKKLQQALQIRLQCNVTLEYAVDPTLIGGAVIRAADLVIDGSVRSKLLRLTQALTS